MNDFTAQIVADNGAWSEAEVLGGYAVVKVVASAETLATIAGTAGFYRVPVAELDNTLASLTVAQRNAIRARVEAMGYTVAEITAAFPNLRNATLRQVLRFAAGRRRKPRYDAIADQIVMDGEIVACASVDAIDATIVGV